MTSSKWPPFKTLQKWKECICNDKKEISYREEEDIGDTEIHKKHIQRDINHVWRGVKSDCLACKGFREGQPRPFKKRKLEKGSLQPITGIRTQGPADEAISPMDISPGVTFKSRRSGLRWRRLFGHERQFSEIW
ncbi:hypothetical protein NOF04DRAFT_13444 [Fusarium oxysporum II5]|uniref:Uncharacterized protein n=1 Tax=Fusarium odoratissimum (strain NRRL 54006) TaxID=1089451 RepID=X0K9Q7_FUSO5|nr:uncharacterized protein FOIG_13308 [Fusarium odoratissimum NRRL 54006]EXL93739.1 hypothetical protein FOIG_13308 [Fusarium odoratissimum NRRL 54006]KAK2134042.1 hypothetical protein NOF04DRAFT_13444 [Fusarium oxysporum II5]